MENRRSLAEARDELIKAQDETRPVEDAELQIVREFADGRRRAVGVPAGGLDYEPIPDPVWLQAIGKGWSGKGPLTLKGSWVQVDFAESSAIAGTGHGFVHIREVLDPAAPDDQSSSLQAPLPRQQKPKNLGGAPKRFDWDRIYIELVSIAHVSPDGLPDRPSVMKRLRDAMTAWEWDDQPSDSAMKEKLRRLYRYLPKLPD